MTVPALAVNVDGDYPATLAWAQAVTTDVNDLLTDVAGSAGALDDAIAALDDVYQPLATVLTDTTAAFTTAQATKLAGIEAAATADMTGAEIVTAITDLEPQFSGLRVGTTNATLATAVIRQDYAIASSPNPLTIGTKGRGMTVVVNVGTAATVPVEGSVLGIDSSMVVRNSTQAGAEHCPLFAVLRYDQGTGFPDSGTPGRGWLTDWTVHGAIATQQELLTGINLVMGNYYNGQPTDSPSGAIFLQAHPDIGGAVDATHAAATTYPNGVGLAVVGVSSGAARGWNVGVQVGGAGGGWEVATSHVGEGMTVRDYDTNGIRLFTMNGSTARAIMVESSGGPVMIGDSQAVSGSNFTDAELMVQRSDKPFSTTAGRGERLNTFLYCPESTADTGAAIGMGGHTGSSLYRAYGYIAGRKLNGSVNDTSGYLQFATHKNGVGMREWLRLDADGLVTLSDGANLAVNATTGTKIGTAATQKLGFWGATPIVRPTGWAAPSGTLTRTTFVGGAATLNETSERLAALITDLYAEGLLGS